MARELVLSPDRALPVDPGTRALAREIYQGSTQGLPLLCLHGHVDAGLFLENTAFANPAELFVTKDHYLVRMLVSQGLFVPEELGFSHHGGGTVETDPRAIWHKFCANWKLFRGTPTRYWIEHTLHEVFGVTIQPDAETADEIYDQIASRLPTPEYRPTSLLSRFNIEVLSTTDSATADLSTHTKLAERAMPQSIIPTFRPDSLLDLTNPVWQEEVEALAALTDTDVSTYQGFLTALRIRRQQFIAQGALATDHAALTANTAELDTSTAAQIYAATFTQEVTSTQALAFQAHMLSQMAQMSCEDGLVMQFHPGVLRNYDRAAFSKYGPDTGFDIPLSTEYARGLRPLLEKYGWNPNFKIVVFTVDETAFSRELAPLAGVYPAMRLGAPWWFLDTPGAMRRFREAVTDTAGLYNMAGFVDDSRSFISLPARHDLARRIDAGYLAQLVAEHRLPLAEAEEAAVDLAYTIPNSLYCATTAMVTA